MILENIVFPTDFSSTTKHRMSYLNAHRILQKIQKFFLEVLSSCSIRGLDFARVMICGVTNSLEVIHGLIGEGKG